MAAIGVCPPAYDILPLMANAGQHEMGIGHDGAQGTLENALSQCQRFDLEPDAALREWRAVAGARAIGIGARNLR